MSLIKEVTHRERVLFTVSELGILMTPLSSSSLMYVNPVHMLLKNRTPAGGPSSCSALVSSIKSGNKFEIQLFFSFLKGYTFR